MIQGKRIRNSYYHLSGILREGQTFRIGVNAAAISENRKSLVGFPEDYANGDAILPSWKCGRVSGFNANGKKGPPKKDLPKEIFMVEFYTTVTDWHGNRHSNVYVCQMRERWQRDQIPPPGEEMLVAVDNTGESKFVSRVLRFGANPDSEKHIVNIFLEAFGFCEVYDENSIGIITAPIKHVNWKLLPSGHFSWEERKQQFIDAIRSTKKHYARVLEGRLSILNSLRPKSVAVGLGGFSDYLGFYFEDRNICILESIKPLNATYVFGQNWTRLSRLSKTEIIEQRLSIRRLLHTSSWEDQVRKILAE